MLPDNPALDRLYAVVPGWGRTVENGSLAEDLQFAYNTIITNEECVKSMGSVSDTSICLSTQEGSSPCQGDSGGPLVLLLPSYVIGVFSYTSPRGCIYNYPAVFERVTNHLSWIREQTGIES